MDPLVLVDLEVQLHLVDLADQRHLADLLDLVDPVVLVVLEDQCRPCHQFVQM